MATGQILRNANLQLLTLVRRQLAIYYTNLDPFQEETEVILHCTVLHHNPYLYYLIVFLAINFIGVYGLASCRHGCHLADLLASDPYIYLHQIFPSKAWKWSDNILFLANFTVLFIYVTFLFNSQVNERFLIATNGPNKSISPDDLPQITSFRRLFYRLLKLTQIPAYIICLLYCYLNVYLNGQMQWTSFTSLFFWFVLFPLLIFQIYYCIFCTFFFILLSAKYIRLQQVTLLAKLTSLNVHPKPSTRAYHRLLHHNTSVQALCRDLLAYGQFWSPRFTIVFLTAIVGTCYCLYCLFFLDNLHWLEKSIFVLAPVQVKGLLFYTTQQCAAIRKMNVAITKQNGHFWQRLNRVKLHPSSIWMLLKLETLQDSQLLAEYGFSLLGGNVITSDTFYLILSYTGLTYLYIIKNATAH